MIFQTVSVASVHITCPKISAFENIFWQLLHSTSSQRLFGSDHISRLTSLISKKSFSLRSLGLTGSMVRAGRGDIIGGKLVLLYYDNFALLHFCNIFPRIFKKYLRIGLYNRKYFIITINGNRKPYQRKRWYPCSQKYLNIRKRGDLWDTNRKWIERATSCLMRISPESKWLKSWKISK